jgi:hypothetical protein
MKRILALLIFATFGIRNGRSDGRSAVELPMADSLQ